MEILLVEPEKSREYYTKYPPLGLLKISAYHKLKGDTVYFAQGYNGYGLNPKKIYITSLFTYSWKPVHRAIRYYKEIYPKSEILVGGIYASLCPDHLRETFGDSIHIHQGLLDEVEDILPDYSLIPNWKASLVYSSRGCIRKCKFCAVKTIEPNFYAKKSIKHLIYPGHKEIIFWDNNILASPYWKEIFQELIELNYKADFNQGLDARLITEEIAVWLKKLKIERIRLAYDTISVKDSLKKAIETLTMVGFKARDIVVYCLFNNPYDPNDTPENFLNRLIDLASWGVFGYPMRFEPLEPRDKGTFISPNWTRDRIEMIRNMRGFLGCQGKIPPHERVLNKFLNAKTFEEAFAYDKKNCIVQSQSLFNL